MLMKKYLFACVVLLSVATLVMAGDDKKVSEQRSLSGFEKIVLKGSPTIKYTQGSQFTVEVQAPKDIIKNVQTQVKGKVLEVSVKSSKWWSWRSSKDKDVTILVTSPDLIGIELLGSGDFECKSHLDTDNLQVRLKGSGDIVFTDIICDKISASVVGSGDLTINKVISQTAEIDLVGSGDIKIKQQKVNRTKIDLKGSGDIALTLQECGAVDCHLLGSGDITLQGDVTKLNSYKRGSGDIHTQKLKIGK